MAIFLIALGVFVVAFLIWLVAVLRDGRRLRGMRRPSGFPTTAKDREEYARMQELRDEVGPVFADDDDSTKVYPLGDVPGREP